MTDFRSGSRNAQNNLGNREGPESWGTSKTSGDWTESLGFQMKRPNIYQFVGQNDVSASQPTVYVCHSFPAKKQMASDFIAAVIIHSGFRG